MTERALPHFSAGSGAPLVVLPGLSGRTGTPTRLKAWMQRKEIADFIGDRTVVSIDRRYDLEPGTSIADLAAEYAHTVTSLFDEPVDILGISTGGTIALQLAADYPELVRRLVLVSSAHRLSDRGRATQRTVAELLRAGRDRRAAAVYFGNTGATPFEHALRSIAGLIAPRAIIGRGDRDLLVTLDAEDDFDLDHRLETIEVRTLITGGELDRFYSSALFTHTSERMPNAQVSVHAGAGHLGTQGNPRLAREILTFLEAA
ncbi:alpha/beta fold hydrolase [Lacisediminihabitans sp. FW035]